MENERTELTFIDQASELIDKSYATDKAGHGMTIRDHKLICQVLDAHTKSAKQDAEQANKQFHDKLISDVLEVIRYELRPIKESIESLRKAIKIVDKEIKEVKKVQKNHGERIKSLESNFNLILKEHLKNHTKRDI